MVFASLADKLQDTFKRLRGKGKLTESDIKTAMREVRLALLEADVNFRVVKDFVSRVSERGLGEEVMKSLTPGQQVIKIVHSELTRLLGGEERRLRFAPAPPTVYMLVGLQGSGKTTTAGKLALHLRKQGRNPLLVACDIYRPAAVQQLETVGKQIDIPVFQMGTDVPVKHIAEAGLQAARRDGRDLVIIDTAGRLHIDNELMGELGDLKEAVDPLETVLVVDAMTGQDAVNVAQSFDEQIGIDGVIMTKLDSDARGGAALSLRSVTGKPILYAGMGEKMDALEPFHPDRMSQRILGMGDVLTLIDRAQQTMDAEKARELEQRLRRDKFTLDDFIDQLSQVRQMGPLDEVLGMLPGVGGNIKHLKKLQVDEKELDRLEAIVGSMTKEERRSPAVINGSRRRRIAAGSGTSVSDVNRLLKQFQQTRKMIRKLMDADKGSLKGLGRLF